MGQDSPKTLEYLRPVPPEPSQVNVPAIVSISTAVAGMLFIVSMCAGVWGRSGTLGGALGGWIAVLLAAIAIVSGGMGALRAPRDSSYYNLALLGYAIGLLVIGMTPFFFIH